MNDDFIYMKLKDVANSKKYPFTIDQLRDYISRKKETGIDSCIFRVGKTVLIRSDLFDAWIEQSKQ